MTSKRDPSMNHFERIPSELVNKILTRLDSHQIYTAILVCKAWKAILTPNVVRSLYSPNPLVFSNAFFVELECFVKTPGNVRVVVDMQGRCYMHHIVNTPQFYFEMEPIKSVTHNGLVAYEKDSKDIYVINPSVKKGIKIEIPSSSFNGFFLRSRANLQFSGMQFDPSTSDFTFILGYSRITLWKYTSSSNTWIDLTQTMRSYKRGIPCCVALYSWVCYFWYANDERIHNRNEEIVVCFDIQGRHFFDIEFPHLDDQEERKSKTKKWALKGCGGWVVLVLNVDGKFKKCWRLVKNGYEYEWVQLTTDLDMLDYLFLNLYNANGKHDLYNVNRQGWWCIASRHSEECDSDDGDYSHFSIYNEHGQLKQCIKKSQLISELGIHYKYVRVRSVWPFQINNICWPRW